jgi:hypothetical protein
VALAPEHATAFQFLAKAKIMKKSTLCFLLLVAGGWAGAQSMVPSLDEQGRKGDMARLMQKQAADKFDAADKDKDGKLSREEAAALPYILSKFDTLDKDKNGFLSWEEYVGHDRWKREPK